MRTYKTSLLRSSTLLLSLEAALDHKLELYWRRTRSS
jgi:hypothetical protein